MLDFFILQVNREQKYTLWGGGGGGDKQSFEGE